VGGFAFFVHCDSLSSPVADVGFDARGTTKTLTSCFFFHYKKIH
jgi:hypothetical protein